LAAVTSYTADVSTLTVRKRIVQVSSLLAQTIEKAGRRRTGSEREKVRFSGICKVTWTRFTVTRFISLPVLYRTSNSVNVFVINTVNVFDVFTYIKSLIHTSLTGLTAETSAQKFNIWKKKYGYGNSKNMEYNPNWIKCYAELNEFSVSY